MGVTVVLDGQAGSCGKGKFIGLLASMAGSDHRLYAIDNFMTNAGHTFVFDDGLKVVSQHIPTSVINPDATLMIGPGAAISLDTLEREIREYEPLIGRRVIYIHPRAMVIQPEHAEKEKQIIKSGSTFKGCGAACADKIMRVPGVKLFGDVYNDLPDVMRRHTLPIQTQYMLNGAINEGREILIEGSQGFDLDINYGLQYPHTTSRQCHAAQLVADCGIPVRSVTDVIMVIRPYPIRINNQSSEGERYSGDYDGAEEITWDIVKERCGAPDDVQFGEMTTVTKRMRRVFEMNWHRLKDAAMVNGPTWIAINFAQYIDWNARGVRDFYELPDKVLDFVDQVEEVTNCRVGMVGTGASNSDVCFSPAYTVSGPMKQGIPGRRRGR